MIDHDIIRAVREEIGSAEDPAATRIVVAMSGGVDSSVVAGLLKHAGYDVIGITLQLYDHGAATGRARACCAGQDIHDARRAAAHLGIAHYVLDFESRFRQAVIDDFADGYLAGQTPIPCVRCNQTVKFSDLFARARGLGAAALATGHYVRSAPRSGSSHRDLFTPADASRDQSYFLFATTQQQLDFLRFPLGAFSKADTRAMAGALGLALADKPDSQDICFVPNGRYADVIGKLRPDAAAPGDIVDLEGRVMASHNGVVNFTVGQRRGLGVAAGEPLYVVRLDPGRRQVVVGPQAALLKDRLALKEVNWIGGSGRERSHRVEVKIRSTRPATPASVRIRGDKAVVMLDQPAAGIAPGQACVIYERGEAGTRVLGGGFIEAAWLAGEPGRPSAGRRVSAEAKLPEELCP